MKDPLLIVMGPTASGKTAVALALAKKVPCELISCDSMQVYRGMPILSQAPNAAEQKKLRAHLVAFLKPSLLYDAAKFRSDVTALIPKIFHRGRTPLISGGTGLYLRMLLDGLFETPRLDAKKSVAFRKKMLREAEKHGSISLHDRLKKVDDTAAQKIHPNDLRRVIRALEVHEFTGNTLTAQKTMRRGIRGDHHCPIFFLDRDRQDLYGRIHDRVDAMMRKGLISEVRRLRQKKMSLTASQALGFKEMAAYLDKKFSREEAVDTLKKNTRHYAKRQLSWFRHESGVTPVPVAAAEKPAATAARILELWRAR